MSKQNSMSHSPVEELYINAENFDKAKKILTQKGIDCTDRKLTEVLSLKSQKNFRTIQRYRSKEKQTPIPRLRLEKLAQYMDVSPEWLCGLDDSPLGGVGYSEVKALEDALQEGRHDRQQILVQYLQSVGIKGKENNWPIINEYVDTSNEPFTTLSGKSVTLDQFFDYLDEIEAAIEYITGRFVKHIKE